MNLPKDLIRSREKPQILDVKLVVNTQVFKIEQLTLKFSNGEIRTFERFVQWPHGIILMVPMLDKDTVLLIREYSAGIEDYTLSLPKGRVEPNEQPIDAALRELREETGYASNKLELMQSITHSPSYSSTKIHIFLAQDLYKSPLPGDEPEPVEVIPWKLSQISELIAREDFHEGRAITALFLAQNYLKETT